jgi:hypothetical protein
MEFHSATKKSEILSFAGKWMELEIILSEVSQAQKAKVTCSPSNVNYRPKTNAAIRWNTGHTKGKLHMGGIREGKETKKLNWLMCSLYRNEYSNLKLARATMGRGPGRSEEDW